MSSTTYEKIVKGATKVKVAAPKPKYIEPILMATEQGNSEEFKTIMRSLGYRVQDSAYSIVFKALIVLHIMIREGSKDLTLDYLGQHPTLINVSGVTKGQHNNDVRFIVKYSKYLTVRAKEFAFTGIDYVRDERMSNSKSTTKGGRLRTLSVEKGVLREVESVQKQIDSLLRNTFAENEVNNDIVLTSFRLLVNDLLSLYQELNEGVINLLEHYFEMSKVDAERSLLIYNKFVDQTKYVVDYLRVAKHLEFATKLHVPTIKHAPTALASSLKEYLDDPNFETNRRQFLAEREVKGSGSAPVIAAAKETSSVSSQNMANGHSRQESLVVQQTTYNPWGNIFVPQQVQFTGAVPFDPAQQQQQQLLLQQQQQLEQQQLLQQQQQLEQQNQQQLQQQQLQQQQLQEQEFQKQQLQQQQLQQQQLEQQKLQQQQLQQQQQQFQLQIPQQQAQQVPQQQRFQQTGPQQPISVSHTGNPFQSLPTQATGPVQLTPLSQQQTGGFIAIPAQSQSQPQQQQQPVTIQPQQTNGQLGLTSTPSFINPGVASAFTGAGFGGYSGQTQSPQQTGANPFDRSNTISARNEQPHPSLKRSNTNPFSKIGSSTLGGGSALGSVNETKPLTSTATGTNPFANTRFGNSGTTALSFNNTGVPTTRPAPITSQVTGGNPFKSQQTTIPQQQAQPVQAQQPLKPQATAGGLERLPTIAVFPETQQQQMREQSQLKANMELQQQQQQLLLQQQQAFQQQQQQFFNQQFTGFGGGAQFTGMNQVGANNGFSNWGQAQPVQQTQPTGNYSHHDGPSLI